MRPGPLRRRARSFVALAAAFGASLLSASAASAPVGSLPIELDWQAPASCPESDDVERDVRRLLGDAPIPENVSPIVAKVSVRQSGESSFDVRIRTTSGGDERERDLRVETCDEARHLVAFLLAFLIDPNASEHSRTEPPPNQPAVVPVLPAPVHREPEPSKARRARNGRSPRWALDVLVGADLGTLPSASLGGELRGGVLFPGWSVEARAAAWLPRREESPKVPGAGGEFTLLDAGLLGCLRQAPWEAVSIQVCAGSALLALRGEGYGVETSTEDTAVFAGATGEGALFVGLAARTSLRLGLGALVPFRRPAFAIHGVGEIHRPSAVSGRAALGFEVTF